MTHVLTFAFVVIATSALAQTPSPGDRWSPWMGCWQIAEESVEDVERLLASAGTGTAQSERSGARVCVTPSADGGATMTTLVNGKPVQTETIIADAKARPLTDATCRGMQQAEWSALGTRIYGRTEVSCGGQPQRTISGFSAVVSGPAWIDIQMIESEGRRSMRVRRYRRAVDQQGASPAAAVRTMPLGG